MKEINRQKIKKAEIAVGMPSLNEADNISFVTQQIDIGLQKYFKGRQAVIINADNNSPDNTGDVFLSTKTKTPKIYLSTPNGVRGKGNALRLFFLKIREIGASFSATFDADIKSITPQWIKCFLEPVIGGYDYVTPLYLRDKNDGTITNHISYPLIYGLLGYNLRQPIGGDFAFSRKMVEYWLSHPWRESTRNYGIDVFMTTEAIRGGFRLAQIKPGLKIHKPSAPKLNSMFFQVVDSFFLFLLENKDLWLREVDIKKLPLLCQLKDDYKAQPLSVDCRQIGENASARFRENVGQIQSLLSRKLFSYIEGAFSGSQSLEVDSSLWPEIVYEVFFHYGRGMEKSKMIELLSIFYFARTASFCQETIKKSQQEAEALIEEEARIFFKKRDYLLRLFGADHSAD